MWEGGIQERNLCPSGESSGNFSGAKLSSWGSDRDTGKLDMEKNGGRRIGMVPPVSMTDVLGHQILPEWERPCHRATYDRKTSSERIRLFVSGNDGRLGKYLLGTWNSRFLLPWRDSHSFTLAQGNFKSKFRKQDCSMKLDIKVKLCSATAKSKHMARPCLLGLRYHQLAQVLI